jgi:hypothetical protein
MSVGLRKHRAIQCIDLSTRVAEMASNSTFLFDSQVTQADKHTDWLAVPTSTPACFVTEPEIRQYHIVEEVDVYSYSSISRGFIS